MRTPDWQTSDGSIRLFLGDCLEVLPTLEVALYAKQIPITETKSERVERLYREALEGK